MDLMKLFYAPMQPFVFHPERIALVACIFVIAFLVVPVALRARRSLAFPLLAPAVAWTLFVPWEAYCKAGGYNIRVDLLLIWPVLLILTITGVVLTFFRIKMNFRSSTESR